MRGRAKSLQKSWQVLSVALAFSCLEWCRDHSPLKRVLISGDWVRVAGGVSPSLPGRGTAAQNMCSFIHFGWPGRYKLFFMIERVIVFIDGSNIFHAIRSLNIRIDYNRLVGFLVEDRRLIRAYFYGAVPQEKDLKKNSPEWESFLRQKRFLEELALQGIKVKTARLRRLPSGEFLEKEVDIMLATDMLSLAYKNAYDTAILVTGDSDFSYTVEEIQSLGKRVENASFKSTSSHILRKVCDRFTLLDDYIDRFIVEERVEVSQEISFWEKVLRLWKR
jgi:Uncharacterized conserved protein